MVFGPPAPEGSRGILPMEGRQSPGPIYMNAAACKKQALSTKRSAAQAAFTRADRFRDGTGGLGSTPGPGPGEYVVSERPPAEPVHIDRRPSLPMAVHVPSPYALTPLSLRSPHALTRTPPSTTTQT